MATLHRGQQVAAHPALTPLTPQEREEARYRLLTSVHRRRLLAREAAQRHDSGEMPDASPASLAKESPGAANKSEPRKVRPLSAVRLPPNVVPPSYSTKPRRAMGDTPEGVISNSAALSFGTTPSAARIPAPAGSQPSDPQSGRVLASGVFRPVPADPRVRLGGGAAHIAQPVRLQRPHTAHGRVMPAPLTISSAGAGDRGQTTRTGLEHDRVKDLILEVESATMTGRPGNVSLTSAEPQRPPQLITRPRPQTATATSTRTMKQPAPDKDDFKHQQGYSSVPCSAIDGPIRPQTAKYPSTSSQNIVHQPSSPIPARPHSAVHLRPGTSSVRRSGVPKPLERSGNVAHALVDVQSAPLPPSAKHVRAESPSPRRHLSASLTAPLSPLIPSLHDNSFVIRVYENLPPEAARWLWEESQIAQPMQGQEHCETHDLTADTLTSLHHSDTFCHPCDTSVAGASSFNRNGLDSAEVLEEAEDEQAFYSQFGGRNNCEVDYVSEIQPPSESQGINKSTHLELTSARSETASLASTQKASRPTNSSELNAMELYEQSRQQQLQRQSLARKRELQEYLYSQGRFCRTTSSGKLRKPWRTFRVIPGQTTWTDLKAAMEAQFRFQHPEHFKSITPASLFAARDPNYAALVSKEAWSESKRTTQLTLTPMSTSMSTLRDTRPPPPPIVIRHALTGDEITCIEDLVPGIELVISLAAEPFAPSYTTTERRSLQRQCLNCGMMFTMHDNDKNLALMKEIQARKQCTDVTTQAPSDVQIQSSSVQDPHDDDLHTVVNRNDYQYSECPDACPDESEARSSTYRGHLAREVRFCWDTNDPLNPDDILVHDSSSPLIFPPILSLPSVTQWQLSRKFPRDEVSRAREQRRASLGLATSREERARPWRVGSKLHHDRAVSGQQAMNAQLTMSTQNPLVGIEQPRFESEWVNESPSSAALASRHEDGSLLNKLVVVTCACKRLNVHNNADYINGVDGAQLRRHILVVWQADAREPQPSFVPDAVTSPDQLYTATLPRTNDAPHPPLRRVAWTEILTGDGSDLNFTRRLRLPVSVLQESHRRSTSSYPGQLRPVKMERDYFLFCVYSLEMLRPRNKSQTGNSPQPQPGEWKLIAHVAGRVSDVVAAAQQGGFFALPMHLGNPTASNLARLGKGIPLHIKQVDNGPILIISAPDIYNAYYRAREQARMALTHNPTHNSSLVEHSAFVPYAYHSENYDASGYHTMQLVPDPGCETQAQASCSYGALPGEETVHYMHAFSDTQDHQPQTLNQQRKDASQAEEALDGESEDDSDPSERRDRVTALASMAASGLAGRRQSLSRVGFLHQESNHSPSTTVTTPPSTAQNVSSNSHPHQELHPASHPESLLTSAPAPSMLSRLTPNTLKVEVPHVDVGVTSPALLRGCMMGISIRLPGIGLAEFAATFKSYDFLELSIYPAAPSSAAALGLHVPSEFVVTPQHIPEQKPPRYHQRTNSQNLPTVTPLQPSTLQASQSAQTPLEYSFVSVVSKADLSYHTRTTSETSATSDAGSTHGVGSAETGNLAMNPPLKSAPAESTASGTVGGRRLSDGQSPQSQGVDTSFSFMSQTSLASSSAPRVAEPDAHVSSVSAIPAAGNVGERRPPETDVLRQILGPSPSPVPSSVPHLQQPILTRLVWNLNAVIQAATALSGDIVTWKQSACLPLVLGTGHKAISAPALLTTPTIAGSPASSMDHSESALSNLSSAHSGCNEYVFSLTATSPTAPAQFLGDAHVRLDEVVKALEAEAKSEPAGALTTPRTLAIAEVDLDPSSLAAPWISPISKLALCFSLDSR